MTRLEDQFGPIDIYLFDQLLRGRLAPGMRVLDAGCGSGRNLIYLLKQGFDVFAVDIDPAAIAEVTWLARRLSPTLPAANFVATPVQSMPFGSMTFEFVISNAVLHFSADDAEFLAMFQGMWRVVRPGGILFCRLASTIGAAGMGHLPLGGRRYLLADGSERYLVDEEQLLTVTKTAGAHLLDPIKTTIVQGQRSMTTWVLQRPYAEDGKNFTD